MNPYRVALIEMRGTVLATRYQAPNARSGSREAPKEMRNSMETVIGFTATLCLFLGIAAGWKGGRLHLHAQQRYGDWRHAIKEVPSAYRLARTAVIKAVKYLMEIVIVVGVVTVIIWTITRLA